MVTLQFARIGAEMEVRMKAESGPGPKLAGANANILRVPLPGAVLGIPVTLPLPGSATTKLKLLEQHGDAHSATWVMEAQGGSEYVLPLRLNGIGAARAEGALLEDAAQEPANLPLAGDALLPASGQLDPALKSLHVRFPAGSGYVEQTVIVRW